VPRWAILGSVLIHVAVAATVLYVARKRPAHADLQVSIFEPTHPKPPPPKKNELPKPPPPPKPIAHQVEVPVPIAAPPPPPAPLAAQPPAAQPGGHAVALGGLQFGNGDDSGGGLEVGGGRVAVPESRLRSKQPRASGLGGEAPCLEEITKPVPIFKADLPYTDEARKSGIEGALTIKVSVGADGAVSRVDVLKSVDPALDAAAVAAAMKWRFKPGMRCGRAVGGAFYVYKQVFELGD